MAKRTSMMLRIRIDGLHETIRAFRDLPKDANRELRQRTLKLSEDLADKVEAAARRDSEQSALLAPTVRAQKDRTPSIRVGGTKRVGRNRVPAYKVLFGANFGARYLTQFRAWNGGAGNEDYFIYSTVEENEPLIADAWRRVADDVLREWGRGG